MDARSGTKTSDSRITHVNRTQAKRRTDHVSIRGKRNNQRGPDNRKRLTTNANLLCQPCTTVKLGEHDISCRLRTSIQGQIQANLIVEKSKEDPPTISIVMEEEVSGPWTLFTDGSYCVKGSRAMLILISPEGANFAYASRFEFEASNNEAEYKALNH
ncbi:hypothetical protein Tco_1546389 [Tanacetum coccineum]